MNIPIIPTRKYLQELRSIGNLSDEEIGDMVYLTRTSVWRLRKGVHKTTDVETGIRIANLHSQILGQKSECR